MNKYQILGLSMILLLFSTFVFADEETDKLNSIKDELLRKRTATVNEILVKIDIGLKATATANEKGDEAQKKKLLDNVDKLISALEKDKDNTYASYPPGLLEDLRANFKKIQDAPPGSEVEIKETKKDPEKEKLKETKTNWIWIIFGIVLIGAIGTGAYKAKRKWIDKKGTEKYWDKNIHDLIKKVVAILKHIRDSTMLPSGYGYSGIPQANKAEFNKMLGEFMDHDRHYRKYITRTWWDKLRYRKQRREAIQKFVNDLSGMPLDRDQKYKLVTNLGTAVDILCGLKSLTTTFRKSGIIPRKKDLEKLKAKVEALQRDHGS